MKFVRPVVLGVILFEAALLATQGPLASLCLKYETASLQFERNELERERRELLVDLAHARRWDVLSARAVELGISLDTIGSDRIGPSPAPPATGHPVGAAPRP